MKSKVIQQFFASLMLMAAPLVLAEPISVSQEALPFSSSVMKPIARRPLKLQQPRLILRGFASWYSTSDAGIKQRTANGERFDDSKMTCASWRYAFGTRLRITNLENGKSVICTVNDRGPAKRLHRVVDLTRGAFRRISDLKPGLLKVKVVPLVD